jgi:hypothetical protein
MGVEAEDFLIILGIGEHFFVHKNRWQNPMIATISFVSH